MRGGSSPNVLAGEESTVEGRIDGRGGGRHGEEVLNNV